MKRYKLLKDLPFAKAGEIVEIWSDGTIVFDDTPSLVRFNKKDVRLFPHWFEEIEGKGWAINTLNARVEEISNTSYSEWAIKNLKSLGLMFPTKQEAEKHLEWLKARATLLEDTTKNGIFNVCHNSVEGLKVLRTADVWSEMTFKTEEDAENSIKNHREEWKIYLGVKY